MKKTLVMVYILLLVSVSGVYAHSGRTDSSGGHNCNVGACAGTYHYHNGGSAPVQLPVMRYIATPTPSPIPVSATITNDYNSQKNEYSIKFDWENIQDSLGYSVSISKYPGSNPGPLVDTYKTVSRFNHVKAGTWYLNLKSKNLNSWSQVIYWSITLPNSETRTVK